MNSILIIDGKNTLSQDLINRLKGSHLLYKKKTFFEGLQIIKNLNPFLILLDAELIDISCNMSIQLIKSFLDDYSIIILFSRKYDPQLVDNAIESGAHDIIFSESNEDYLFNKIKQTVQNNNNKFYTRKFNGQLEYSSDKFIYKSSIMQELDFKITKYAKQNVDVLLFGETGVGKDLIASQIHQRSSRNTKPFIEIPLMSLNENLIESELFGYEKGAFSGADYNKVGKLESADGGTVYIPEISDISEKIQLKLLHFMQYKSFSYVGQKCCKEIKVDIRIIFATNEDLKTLMLNGRIRKDFYYRIYVNKLIIPPLRQRIEDFELLSQYFLDKYSELYGKTGIIMPDSLLSSLKNYPWIGNIRELSFAFQNAIINARNYSVLEESYFNDAYSTSLNNNEETPYSKISYKRAEEIFKKKYFSSLIKENDGCISKVANISGLSRQAIYKIVKELEINY